MNGASRQSGVGIGLQLTSPTGERIEQAVHLGFDISNNESEYEALIARVELTLAVGANNLLMRSVHVGSETKDVAEAKKKKEVMGLNEKQRAPELLQRPRW